MPLHFTAFHPDFKMRDIAAHAAGDADPGPADRAASTGLRYVYTGNVHDPDGQTTRCPGCGGAVVVRDWYDMHAVPT